MSLYSNRVTYNSVSTPATTNEQAHYTASSYAFNLTAQLSAIL